MKRIGLSLLAVLVFVTVIASCFSFSVFADFSEQPLIRFKGASTVYQTLVDQQEFNMLSSSYISVFDLNRIRIVNTSNLSGQYLLYQIILVPCVNASDSSPTIAPKSGSINITSMSGTDSAKITCTPVSIRDHHSGEAVWFNKALLVSVQVIVSDSSNDNINLDFNPVSLFSITSTSNYLVTCYQVNCYSSDSSADEIICKAKSSLVSPITIGSPSELADNGALEFFFTGEVFEFDKDEMRFRINL